MDVNKIKGRAESLLQEHGDKIEKGVGRVEKFAKSRTAKHDDKIDKVTGKIRGFIAKDAGNGPDATGNPGHSS